MFLEPIRRALDGLSVGVVVEAVGTVQGPGCGSMPWVTKTSLGFLRNHVNIEVQRILLCRRLYFPKHCNLDVPSMVTPTTTGTEKVFRMCLALAPLVYERATAVRERNVEKAAVSVLTRKHGLSIRAVRKGRLEATASRPSGQPGRETVERETDLGAAIRMELLVLHSVTVVAQG